MLVRYLGAGGLYVYWRGTAIMTAPFFSNPGLLEVAFGNLRWREGDIARGLTGLPEAASAIFAGHAHHDHVADLVPILQTHAPAARLYVNRTAHHMLGPYPALRARSEVLEAGAGWDRVRDAQGRLLPIRYRALRSRHAPHLGRLHFYRGSLDRDWRYEWTDMRWRDFLEGEVFAFVFDLLDEEGRARFRIYANDAASPRGWGEPDAGLARERRFDLAALVMASYYLVEEYPEALLRGLRPRHVLAIHYEDFFQPPSAPVRFVPLLTDARANRFLSRVDRALGGSADGLRPPLPPVCGPSGRAVTMAVPGEWLRFRAGS